MSPLKSRRVLGIDPGYDRLGLAVLEGDASKPVHIWSDCVIPPKGAHEMRLAAVYAAVTDAIKEYQPDALAIETLFFSSNRTSALGASHAAGAAGLFVQEYAPQHVKLAVTGYGASDKAAIARMIPHLIKLPEKKRLDDELDAVALAIAGLANRASHLA
jgi:crossover junction endodeoxyribonuclease RuvC